MYGILTTIKNPFENDQHYEQLLNQFIENKEHIYIFNKPYYDGYRFYNHIRSHKLFNNIIDSVFKHEDHTYN